MKPISRKSPVRRFLSSSMHRSLLLVVGLLACPAWSLAQDIPTVFTEKIFKGSGTIDMLLDVSSTELNSYFTDEGRLILAVDVNENNSGPESSDSLGVAINQIELMITTTDGDFTFSDFYTNTSAYLKTTNSTTPAEYYTLFGTGGSSTYNSGTSEFPETMLDDVIYIDDIYYTGELLSARLNISFVSTDTKTGGANEDFFDFSGGFEDFAIINEAQSLEIEALAKGISTASSELVFTTQALPAAPGAPFPPWIVVAAFGFLIILRTLYNGKKAKA